MTDDKTVLYIDSDSTRRSLEHMRLQEALLKIQEALVEPQPERGLNDLVEDVKMQEAVESMRIKGCVYAEKPVSQSKYQPHQGAKECARRLKRLTAL